MNNCIHDERQMIENHLQNLSILWEKTQVGLIVFEDIII